MNKVKYLEEFGKSAKYNPRELKMAEELIDGMTGKWQPQKYKDTYYNDLMKRINTKIKQGKSHTVTEPEDVPEERESKQKVVDLLPLLRKSLEARKSGKGPHKPGRGRRETAS